MSTILLVEDDAALRDGLTELFTREGYSVTTAANAAEARQNFSVYIDLIILDIPPRWQWRIPVSGMARSGHHNVHPVPHRQG